MRVDSETRELIERAAIVAGQSRTEFTLDAARNKAMDVLADKRRFSLSPEQYDAFMQVLESPPPPGEKLQALVKRTPPWA